MVKLPKLYSQLDPVWANNLLGFNSNPLFNIYNYGCLISCLSMIAEYYGKAETPASLNDKLKALGAGRGFVANSGIYVHGAIEKIYPDIKEVRLNTPGLLTDDHLVFISEQIMKGYPVMFHIDTNISTVRPDSHFVLAIGMDVNDVNNVTIADPIKGVIHSLKDYQGGVRRMVESIFVYEGTAPTVDPIVEDRKSVRDMLVIKATEADRMFDYHGVPEEVRVQYNSGMLVIDKYRELEKQLADLRNSTGYNAVPTGGNTPNVPTEQDKNVLFADVADLLNKFWGRFKK